MTFVTNRNSWFILKLESNFFLKLEAKSQIVVAAFDFGVGEVLIAHLENNMLSEQAAHHKMKLPNPQNQSSLLVRFFEHHKLPVK